MPVPKGEKDVDRILAALDAKFAQQEQLIRDLIGTSGPAVPHGFQFNPDFTVLSAELPPEASEPVVRDKVPSGKAVRTLGAKVMSEKWAQDPPVKKFVKENMDVCIGIVVIVNVTLMILQSQWTAGQTEVLLGLREPSESVFSESFFDSTEYAFFALYLADLLIRLVVLKKEWYFDRERGHMYMNMFDAFLVGLNFVELIVLPFWNAGTGQELNANTIRLIKLARVFRTLRVVKTLSILRQLRQLVATCIASVGALFWSLMLLLFLKLVFALMISQAIVLFIQSEEGDQDTRLLMYAWFGSFFRAMYTMFEITYSGGWPLLVRPVLDQVSAWYALPFLLYVSLVVFAVLRIVTALFIKETLSTAAQDAELVIEDSRRCALQYQRKLEELFKLVDDDSDGHLTAEEFVQAMRLPSVDMYLKYLEITVRDCGPLFDILAGDDGLITISEFCKGVMQLKGQARALDIVILQHENAKLMKECKKITKFMQLGRAPAPPDAGP